MDATIEQVQAAVPWLHWEPEDGVEAGLVRYVGHPNPDTHPDDEMIAIVVRRDVRKLMTYGHLGERIYRPIDGETLDDRLRGLRDAVAAERDEMRAEAQTRLDAAASLERAPIASLGIRIAHATAQLEGDARRAWKGKEGVVADTHPKVLLRGRRFRVRSVILAKPWGPRPGGLSVTCDYTRRDNGEWGFEGGALYRTFFDVTHYTFDDGVSL